jgi:hypothetical protein
MTRTIDRRFLSRLRRPVAGLSAEEAGDLAAELGGLARWWLKDEVLRLAARADDNLREDEVGWWLEKPRLAATEGACWIIFGNDQPTEQTLLRPAFLLPLCWVPDRPHSPRLPTEVRLVAEDALRVLQELPSVRRGSWGLQPGGEVGALDLGPVPFGAASGWAALAAGLILAAEKCLPNPRVWATGRWESFGGIGRVDHLPAKLELAHEHEVEEFFVPAEQAAELAATAEPGTPRIRSLYGARDPRAALRDYLARLDAPPPISDTGDEKRKVAAYYLRLLDRDPAGGKQYYQEQLLPAIVRQCRAQAETLPWSKPPACLVSIASDNPELVYLAVEALRPRRCLVLYTPDYKEKGILKRALSALEKNSVGCCCRPSPFTDGDDMETQMATAIRAFTADAHPEEVIFDLTPGHKLMSLALAYSVAQPGNWLLYLRHRREGNAVVPFSERLLAWPAGQSWAQPRPASETVFQPELLR